MRPSPATVFGERISHRAPALPALSTESSPLPAVPEMTYDESVMARDIDHTLGNPELPIAQYREQIVSSVDRSQAVIITAETGAGKSTQVPQFLAGEGYEVIVTQPRIVAARSVAARVRDEVVGRMGHNYDSFVGYRTARERGDDEANQILFVTDGLQQVRELTGHGVGKKQVLVLDEVHEWNENMEVLVAWAKKRMDEEPDFKVVVMSATMEAGPLSRYFAEGKRDVPVIEVPGRTHDVEKSEGGDVVDQTILLAREGKNTLVFVPGVAEIAQVMAEIERAKIPGATILPLHGRLDANEQSKVFARCPGVKIIVATNVAETSVTIDDIDAVVDSGLERRMEVRNGVEGLYLRPIARANCLQRAGRAGRTKKGEYILAQLGNNPFVGLKDREEYGTPEILRTRLDGTVLRLAKNGFDAAEMGFFHGKDDNGRDIQLEIAAAKERLQRLGALRDDGGVTAIGRDMERMPLESHYARMMVEARKYGPEVQTQLAALIAVQEVDGVVQFRSRNRPCNERWRALLSDDHDDSDMIVQLEVFIAAETRKMSDSEKRDNDIYGKGFNKAREVLHQLRGVEKLRGQNLCAPTSQQREQLVRCIVSGMVDNLYIYSHGCAEDAYGNIREISSRSTICPGPMVVGNPFDLEISTSRGSRVLHLLEGLTNVPHIELLREVAPQLFREEFRQFGVQDNVVVEQWGQYFNGHKIGDDTRESHPSAERRRYIIDRLADDALYRSEYATLNTMIGTLQTKTSKELGKITTQDVHGMLDVALPAEVASLKEAMEYLPPVEIDDLLSFAEREQIDSMAPDQYFGMQVRYVNGLGIVTAPPIEALVRLPDEAMTLPDGRELHVQHGLGGSRLRQFRDMSIEQLHQQKIADEERHRYEAAIARHEAIRQQLYMINRDLGEVWDTNNLPQIYQDAAEDLTQRVAILLGAELGQISGYEDQKESVRSLVEVLKANVKAWAESMAQDSVSNDALLALQNHFRSR